MFLKSRIDLFEEIAETVRQLHSYEVPEMLGLPVVIGSKNYLVWLAESLKGE